MQTDYNRWLNKDRAARNVCRKCGKRASIQGIYWCFECKKSDQKTGRVYHMKRKRSNDFSRLQCRIGLRHKNGSYCLICTKRDKQDPRKRGSSPNITDLCSACGAFFSLDPITEFAWTVLHAGLTPILQLRMRFLWLVASLGLTQEESWPVKVAD